MQVLFSDETYVDVGEIRSNFVRRGEREPVRLVHTRNHRPFRQRVLFWGCLSAIGPGPLVHIPCTMRTGNYIETLEKHMLPHCEAIFSHGDTLFQHDNAPCHKSQATMAFLNDAGIPVIEWPAYSPDLNPIENLWAIMKARIHKAAHATKEDVINEAMARWQDADIPSICNALVASIPERIAECLRNKGGYTHY